MKLLKAISTILLIFIAFSLFTSPVSADQVSNDPSSGFNEPDSAEYSLTSPAYWTGYLSDASGLLASPFHWDKSDWLKASAVAGVTILLYQNDQSIKSWAQNSRNAATDSLALSARAFGDVRYTLAPLTLFYAYGCWKDDLRVRRTAALSIESVCITGLFTEVLKFGGHRHRPNTGDSYDSWDGPGLSLTNFSFPSGHSSSAFALATVIATEYGDYRLVPVVAYGIAGLTAWSRVNDNYHWASDVFFGSALGYFTAKGILNRHEEINVPVLTVFPEIKEGSLVVRAAYQF